MTHSDLDTEWLSALLDAARNVDLDSALELGLMEADSFARIESLTQLGKYDPLLIHRLLKWRDERTIAIAARDRYRSKQRRESDKAALLRDRRSSTQSAGASTARTLPQAAQSALERAKARAAARKKPQL